MNCRGCGKRIPENYLKRDSFECPYCGRRYRRKSAQTTKKVNERRVSECPTRSQVIQRNARAASHDNSGILEKLKRIALHRVWRLPLIAWVAVILVVGIAGNATLEEHETENYVQTTADKSQEKTEFEQSMVTTESVTEVPAPTVTHAPEMTAGPTTTVTTTVNKISTNSLCGLIESVVAQNFKNYNVSVKDGIITVNLWQEGIATELAVLSQLRNDEASEKWGSVKESMIGLARSICGVIDAAGRDDVVLNLNILNDQNLDNVLLTIYDTYVVYDVLDA